MGVKGGTLAPIMLEEEEDFLVTEAAPANTKSIKNISR
jgi:hypothetical protein